MSTLNINGAPPELTVLKHGSTLNEGNYFTKTRDKHNDEFL